MTKPVPTEHEEQKAVIQWFNVQHKTMKGRLVAVPNGAHLAGSKAQRAAKITRMKAEGLSPGFPDLLLPVARGGFHGLAIEMKRVKGSSTSDEQLEWLDFLARQGYLAVLCKGADAAIDTIQAYLAEGEANG
ncbi:MAG: VRR-NUC domain-containing protein [Alcanivorax sediminis]|uniref:VRR-NUC domain-containing protein n=1 Tax=Alcanivorax sediminis TaxID=2663008 RepID=UPI003C54D198